MKNVMLSTLALALSLYTNAGPTQKASKAPRVSHEDEEANIKDTSHLVKFISEILTLASCGNEELLVQIKRLSCTNCELRDIPSEFFHLSGLEELILNNNNLCYVTPNIAKFKSLKILDLSNNRIKELPETIGEMRSLIDINLSNNFLEKLPNKIANLRQLERLTVRHNTLKKLPSGFSKLKQLQYLDIRNNPLQKLPSGMSTLEDLLVLKLGDRPPTYVNHKAHEIINCNKPAIQMPDEDGATMLGFPVGVRMFLHRLQTNRSFFDEMRHKVKSIHLRGNIEALVSKETVCIITAITDMISHRNIDLQRPNNPESSIRSAPPGPGGSWR